MTETDALAPVAAARPPASSDTAGAGLRLPDTITVLGECVSLLARDSHFGRMSLSDLEWAVLPALINKQYLMMRGKLRKPLDGGPPLSGDTAIPVGMALWARTSQQVSDKLAAQRGDGAAFHLEPDEWRSGEDVWVLTLVSPPPALPALRRQLELQFAGRTVQYFAVATLGDEQPDDIT